MGTDLELKEEEIVSKKRAAWSVMGEAIYKSEMKLQAMAQALIQKIKLPTSLDEITAAEALIKQLRGDVKVIEAERKTITSRLDDVCQRLMLAEKSTAEPLTNLYNAIVDLKKKHEEEQRRKMLIADEGRRVKESILSYIISKEHEFKTFVTQQITKAYEYALQNGITPDEVDAYVDMCFANLKKDLFLIKMPTVTAVYMKEDEKRAIFDQAEKKDGSFFANEFLDGLRKKFSDYNIAFANKKDALALSIKEDAEKASQLNEEKTNQELAAKIEASVSPQLELQVAGDLKALKKYYEIDMPDSIDSAVSIMAAFVANKDKCLPKLKVTKWFSFTPAQAGTALAKVKADDPNFHPAGLRFKEVSKL